MLVDCVWNNWSAWTSCSKLCGGGQQSHTRTIKDAAQGGGQECIGPEIETKVCNTQDCLGGNKFNSDYMILSQQTAMLVQYKIC